MIGKPFFKDFDVVGVALFSETFAGTVRGDPGEVADIWLNNVNKFVILHLGGEDNEIVGTIPRLREWIRYAPTDTDVRLIKAALDYLQRPEVEMYLRLTHNIDLTSWQDDT